MSKKPETLFKEKVIREINQISASLIWFFKTQEVTLRGIPDLILCVKGKFMAYELKIPGGKTDELQWYNLHKIREAGGIGKTITPETWPSERTFLKKIIASSRSIYR